MSKYDIFISYKRDETNEGITTKEGGELARYLKDSLEPLGKIYMDVESQIVGDFRESIESVIKESNLVILILSKNSIESYKKPGNASCLEIETALRCNKPILPITVYGDDVFKDLGMSIKDLPFCSELLKLNIEKVDESRDSRKNISLAIFNEYKRILKEKSERVMININSNYFEEARSPIDLNTEGTLKLVSGTYNKVTKLPTTTCIIKVSGKIKSGYMDGWYLPSNCEYHLEPTKRPTIYTGTLYSPDKDIIYKGTFKIKSSGDYIDTISFSGEGELHLDNKICTGTFSKLESPKNCTVEFLEPDSRIKKIMCDTQNEELTKFRGYGRIQYSDGSTYVGGIETTDNYIYKEGYGEYTKGTIVQKGKFKYKYEKEKLVGDKLNNGYFIDTENGLYYSVDRYANSEKVYIKSLEEDTLVYEGLVDEFRPIDGTIYNLDILRYYKSNIVPEYIIRTLECVRKINSPVRFIEKKEGVFLIFTGKNNLRYIIFIKEDGIKLYNGEKDFVKNITKFDEQLLQDA